MTQNIFGREQGRLDLHQRQPDGRTELPGRHGLQLFDPPSSWAIRTSCSPPGCAYNWNEKPGRHHGFGFRANYPNDLWNVQTTYAYYGEALDPGWAT